MNGTWVVLAAPHHNDLHDHFGRPGLPGGVVGLAGYSSVPILTFSGGAGAGAAAVVVFAAAPTGILTLTSGVFQANAAMPIFNTVALNGGNAVVAPVALSGSSLTFLGQVNQSNTPFVLANTTTTLAGPVFGNVANTALYLSGAPVVAGVSGNALLPTGNLTLTSADTAATVAVTGVSNAANPTITTATNHGLITGQTVVIAGVNGAPSVNGTWVVASVPAANTFTITLATAPGVFTSGGVVGMPSSVTINGGTLTLSGANGALTAASAVTVNPGGALTLDNRAANLNNRINLTAPLATLTLAGGAFNFFGNSSAPSTQALPTALTLNNAGASVINVTPGAGQGSTLQFAGLVRRCRAGGSRRSISRGPGLPAPTSGSALSTRRSVLAVLRPTVANGLLAASNILPYATVNGGNFAAYSLGRNARRVPR